MVPFTLLEVSYFCLQSQKAGWIVKPTQYIPSCSVVDQNDMVQMYLTKHLENNRHTQSPLGSTPGTNTLISLDFAVVIDAPKESLLKYN